MNVLESMKHFKKLAEIMKDAKTEEEAKQRSIAYLELQGLPLPPELAAMKKQ